MIKSISLINFQSHKKSVLKFSPYVNSIIGISDHGKSAILRGFRWVRDNRPAGFSFISHWNQNDKGMPINRTYVRVVNDNANIIRLRDSESNAYKIQLEEDGDWKTFDAIKMDVPDEVSSLLNLGEVNFQRQMDAPFLLSESASDVARFFNKEIRLDLIDSILGNAERRRKQEKRDIAYTEETISKYADKLSTFAWVANAEEIINKGLRIEESIEENKIRIDNLQNAIDWICAQETILEKYANLDDAQKIIDAIGKHMDAIIKNETTLYLISNIVNEIYSQNNEIEIYSTLDMGRITEVVNILITAREKFKTQANTIESLETIVDEIEKYQGSIIKIDDEINECLESIPNVCPLCGNKMDGDICLK